MSEAAQEVNLCPGGGFCVSVDNGVWGGAGERGEGRRAKEEIMNAGTGKWSLQRSVINRTNDCVVFTAVIRSDRFGSDTFFLRCRRS